MNLINGKTLYSTKGSLVKIKGFVDNNEIPTLEIEVVYQGNTTRIQFKAELDQITELTPNTLTQQLVSLFVLDPKGFSTYPKHVRYAIGMCVKLNPAYFAGFSFNNRQLTICYKEDKVKVWAETPDDGFELTGLNMATISTLKRVISLGMFFHHKKEITA